MVNGKEKLIVAIDTNEFDKAKELIDKLEDSVDIFKVGLEQYVATRGKTVDYLKEKLNGFNTCDNYYETSDSFDEVYEKIAKDLISNYKEKGDLVYAVPGHPLVAERSVFNLMKLCDENNITYEILPAVSFIDAMMDVLKIDPIEGLKVIDAFDIKNQVLDKRICPKRHSTWRLSTPW